jgi:hypothetical protein
MAALTDISSSNGDQASSAKGITEQQQHLCMAAQMDISSSCGGQASSARGTTEQQQRLCIAALMDTQVAVVTKPAALMGQLSNSSIFS